MKNLVPPEILATLRQEPVSIPDIVKYLDNNPNVTTSNLCKLIGIPAYKVYRYRNRQRMENNNISLVNGVVPKGSSKSHARYSAEDKYNILEKYVAGTDDVKSRILREYGLYTSDIQRWKDQVKLAAIEKLGTRKIRSDKKSTEQLRIEELESALQEQEKTTAKLTALIILQKKIEEIFTKKIKS